VPGVVVPGEQLGRQLGFPTANVQTPPERLLPADGIYVVTLCLGSGSPLSGVASLGVRPTIGGRPRLLEVHVLDWEGDLYGQAVSVAFLERLRGEENFPSLEALKQQIDRDADQARAYFEAHPLPEFRVF
jgi:riboflavin kinase/FMN adenylyltransferase